MSSRRMLHTMIRVGDLERSINFYTQRLGMKLLRKWDIPQDKYTLAFLGYDTEKNTAVLELTYNYGVTSYKHDEAYGHIAIGVEDVKAVVADMRQHDVPVDYEDDEGFMAFVVDPDGYYVELLNTDTMISKAEEMMKEQGTA
ncbi:trypanothione-dependent glyoxalase I (GLO1) [Leptomonas pyrrhocoris]|uniref:lactoylglutathione lyase n=1 Tax=Leptomonas pyrrhocoris TaxID=157538 RepID=A0A0N0E0D4_LEPPY|nr:trypanothione-dependent glyoxalase I (GLO1) [Leptomonas pyrrhocoris]KPA86312.1 trypanothione-dependent glyoxalase I (GLO1) [Leptomonas pyrrhocoris]|eukprot:XP_015664751.1 trypanothione-dependent glyoxalase I (GLO1) [Leptomonas pyrrhocoris]